MTTGVSVFGLGYVGGVSAACLAKEGHDVVGVDVNPAKVAMINAGRSTIVEEGIGALVEDMVASGRLRATVDVCEAVCASTVSLICVGTPSRPNGSIELDYIERVCSAIGEILGKLNRWHTVVIRSTVLPGTIDSLVIPTLEQASGKVCGEDFGVCSNPEFLREGTSIKDFYSPPFTIIGARDEASAAPLRALYDGIGAPVHVTPIRVAETVKYACNCFHALKVGFANEIGNFCKAVGVDSHAVMEIFCEDTKLNISPAYLRPGFAFGGSCLPKDLRAVVYRARQADVETPVLNALLESNELQVKRAYDMVSAAGSRKVGVLGMAFKSGTDDLRESPMVTLIERLIGRGYQLSIYDRDVSEANLIGANRDYIEREIPHIWSLMRQSVDDVVGSSDVIVMGNAGPESRAVESTLRDGQMVIDLARAFGPRTTAAPEYQGICW